MATPGSNETSTPGAATPGDGTLTTGTPDGVNDNNSSQVDAPKNQEKYKLMEGNDDYDNDDDEGDIKIDDLKNKPFGGYQMSPKQQGPLKQSDIFQEAISKMSRDINLGEFERKENEALLEEHFSKLIKIINNKKLSVISELNNYYDQQKEESTKRINELKIKYNGCTHQYIMD
eukprot:499009_1